MEANAQTPPSNLRFLQEVFQRCAARAVSAMPDSVIVLTRPPAGENSPERLLHNALVEIVQSKKGYSVFDASAVSEQGVAVQYKLLQCDLTYARLPRGWRGWLGAGQAVRAANVSVDFDIHHRTTGRIYWQGIIEAAGKDTVQVDEIVSLESPAMPLTTGRWLQRDDARRRWLEPLILAAATGAVIYTFYTLRSQ